MSALETLERLKREAFAGGLPKASLQALEEYSAALCHSDAFTVFADREFPQVCETVRTHLLRSHIEKLQSHVVDLHNHITKLNDSNTKLQKLVVVLTVVAVIAGSAQAITAILPYVGLAPAPQLASAKQKPSLQLSTPIQPAAQSPGQATKKVP